jgi:hypothetical protein
VATVDTRIVRNRGRARQTHPSARGWTPLEGERMVLTSLPKIRVLGHFSNEAEARTAEEDASALWTACEQTSLRRRKANVLPRSA